MAAQRLYKRGKTWWGWFYDSEGSRVIKSTRCIDRKAAEAVMRTWERMLQRRVMLRPSELR